MFQIGGFEEEKDRGKKKGGGKKRKEPKLIDEDSTENQEKIRKKNIRDHLQQPKAGERDRSKAVR